MSGARTERLRVHRRGLLARALGRAEAEGLEALVPEDLARAEGFPVRKAGTRPEDLLFLDEDDLRESFQTVLEHAGLLEAGLAWARHLEEDGDLWRRRLALEAREPGLRLRRADLDQAWRALLTAHFRRWGAATTAGERVAEVEADLTLAALRGAARRWREGEGRPVLPVLVHESLGALWPALYAHARRRG